MPMPPSTKVGDNYAGIIAIRYDHNDAHGNQYWLFRCRCGREWVCRGSMVRNGQTTSCGKGRCEPGYRHGRTSEGSRYRRENQALWRAISQCENPNDQMYAEVGANGIKVCARWKHSFENFLADVGPCPKGKRFLQRIDRTKDFKRGNVRWADELEMGCHTKDNHWVTIDGITLHLAEWSRVTGIGYTSLVNRLRRGWSFVEALTTPLRQPKGDYQPQWRKNRERLVELGRRNFQNRKTRRTRRKKA